MKAGEWADTVRGLAERRGATYEPVGGLNPKGGPVALCPGGTNRITGRLSDDLWGAACDADEHEQGGLFSKAVLPRAVLAKAHMPDLAQVVPTFNVESIERAERVERDDLAPQGRVRVDRVQPALPGHRPRGLRPGGAARALQPRVPRLGRADPQPGRLRDHRPPALLHVAPRGAQRRRVRGRARPRRQAVQPPARRDGGARSPYLRRRPVARRPRAVSPDPEQPLRRAYS